MSWLSEINNNRKKWRGNGNLITNKSREIISKIILEISRYIFNICIILFLFRNWNIMKTGINKWKIEYNN